MIISLLNVIVDKTCREGNRQLLKDKNLTLNHTNTCG